MQSTQAGTRAVVLEAPERLSLQHVALKPAGPSDVIVRTRWTGISTGTERLLYTGTMPPFPGMGYPLVPGYESVGEVIDAGPESGHAVGDLVFVPGATCYSDVHALFGGSAGTLISAGERVIPVPAGQDEQAVLFALAGTAWHALQRTPDRAPDLIIGHGILGRLLARLSIASGAAAPLVWETNARRAGGASGYNVVHPDEDDRKDYRSIIDCSGDAGILDQLVARLGHGGSITLAGFYHQPLAFNFPAAFMREVSLHVAAEWQRPDMLAVCDLVSRGALDLNGLITHRSHAEAAEQAYRVAFADADCLKMILDWRDVQ